RTDDGDARPIEGLWAASYPLARVMVMTSAEPSWSGDSLDFSSGGRTIGDYEIIGRLAIGGMAELFLAKRVGLHGFQKVVVVKRILPQFADHAEFVEMFLHEARLAARLDHPNIVQVFDI